jgi:GMP synthase PP-ATPase subunit
LLGPGLTIRIPGEITKERLEILRSADMTYLDEITRVGRYGEIRQTFAVVTRWGVIGEAVHVACITPNSRKIAPYFAIPWFKIRLNFSADVKNAETPIIFFYDLPCRISERKIRKPTTPVLAVVRECPVCLFMATTTASRAAVTLIITARLRRAKRQE